MGLFCASSGGQQGERAAHGAGRGASRLFASKEPFRITSVCDLGPPVCVMWTKETLCSARETDRGTEGWAGTAHGPLNACAQRERG